MTGFYNREAVCLLRQINPTHTCIFKVFKPFYYEGWNFNSGNYLFTTDTK